MNNLASRIAAVNEIASRLLGADHRNKDSIHATLERLNTRWDADAFVDKGVGEATLGTGLSWPFFERGLQRGPVAEGS